MIQTSRYRCVPLDGVDVTPAADAKVSLWIEEACWGIGCEFYSAVLRSLRLTNHR